MSLPDVQSLLVPLLKRVAPERRPLLGALAERLAAARYRVWADAWAQGGGSDADAAALRACADREEEIARTVEDLHANAAAIQRDIQRENPDIPEITRSLFEGRPLREQLDIQARAERFGAATWRAVAAAADAPPRRAAFLRCAELEEASALVVEGILRDDAAPRA